MSSVCCVVSQQILDTAPLSGFKVHEKMASHIGLLWKGEDAASVQDNRVRTKRGLTRREKHNLPTLNKNGYGEEN